MPTPHLLLQAFVKARGDGLGFDLAKAEFHFDAGNASACVWMDGKPQPRWRAPPFWAAFCLHVSDMPRPLTPLSRNFWLVGHAHPDTQVRGHRGPPRCTPLC